MSSLISIVHPSRWFFVSMLLWNQTWQQNCDSFSPSLFVTHVTFFNLFASCWYAFNKTSLEGSIAGGSYTDLGIPILKLKSVFEK